MNRPGSVRFEFLVLFLLPLACLVAVGAVVALVGATTESVCAAVLNLWVVVPCVLGLLLGLAAWSRWSDLAQRGQLPLLREEAPPARVEVETPDREASEVGTIR